MSIWKSKLHPYYKNSGKILLLLGITFIFLPLIISAFLMLTKLLISSIIIIYTALQIVFGLVGLIFIWVALQFFVTYLLIEETGIKIRIPYRLFRQKFIPFDLIQKVESHALPEYYGSFRIPWMRIGNKILGLTPTIIKSGFLELIIFIKQQKPIKITSAWVAAIEEAKDIITDNIKKEPEIWTCQICGGKEINTKCQGCGKDICKNCKETIHILSDNEKCILCLYNETNKRTFLSFLLCNIPTVLFFLIISLNPQVNILKIFIDLDFKHNPLVIYYWYFNIFFSFTFIPYGFALFFSNLFRIKRIKKIKIPRGFLKYYLVLLMGIAIIFIKAILITQVLYYNDFNLIIFMIIEYSVLLLLLVVYFLMMRIKTY